MSALDARHLAGFEHQLDLNLEELAAARSVAERRLYTYLVSYPHLRDRLSRAEPLDLGEFIVAKSMVYGLMPTVMNLRKGDPELLLGTLSALRVDGQRLSHEKFADLRAIVNNSVVGASKLLHFLRPDTYPVWDSRIDRFMHGDDADTSDANRYFDYLADFDRVRQDPLFETLRASLAAKLGYEIHTSRAFEMIMYLADLKALSFVEPPHVSVPARPDTGAAEQPQVPRYKRDRYTFISNLGPVTLDPEVPETLLRDGYLLSERYTNNATLQLAATARARRNLLISDNGNWTRMSALARRFSDAGQALLERAEAEAETGGLSAATRQTREELKQEVARACAEAVDELDLSEIIDTQLRMKPDYMIGLEDFTVPVLMNIGLMHPVFAPEPEEVRAFQEQTRSLFSRQTAGEFGFRHALAQTAMYLVLHAYDYPSAEGAAAAARPLQKGGLAISYGAPMASRRWIEEIRIGDSVVALGEKLPESYLAAHALTLGTINGHDDDTPVHILGVGTPILIMLLGFLLKHSRAVSIDSSAPLQDAFDGRIYGTRQAFLKMRMYRLAALCLVTNKPYESKTLFFREFNQRHPDDWEGLRQTLGVTGDSDPREIERILESDQALVRKHIPFFTRLRSGDDPFFWDLRVSRAGHNYLVLREIVEHVRRRRDDWPALKAWTESEVTRYAAAGHPKWARAVEKCFEITATHSPETVRD
ncbi:MAG: hypothetical protein AAGI72_16605 [Pseudomonadota bacterium]